MRGRLGGGGAGGRGAVATWWQTGPSQRSQIDIGNERRRPDCQRHQLKHDTERKL